MRTPVKGMVSDSSFMACRHSRVEIAFLLGMFNCVNLALHMYLGGE